MSDSQRVDCLKNGNNSDHDESDSTVGHLLVGGEQSGQVQVSGYGHPWSLVLPVKPFSGAGAANDTIREFVIRIQGFGNEVEL
jgi:hypothetical protein